MRSISASLIFFLVLTLANWPVWAAQPDRLSFSPTLGVSAEVVANGREVTVTVKSGNGLTTRKIQVETEKSLKLIADDYNFDGYPDISISHADDGMGTYKIYQIYVYSAREQQFKILLPKCGDEFINIVVSRSDRSLTNSYFADNRFQTCTVNY